MPGTTVERVVVGELHGDKEERGQTNERGYAQGDAGDEDGDEESEQSAAEDEQVNRPARPFL